VKAIIPIPFLGHGRSADEKAARRQARESDRAAEDALKRLVETAEVVANQVARDTIISKFELLQGSIAEVRDAALNRGNAVSALRRAERGWA
jgi:hypothetical protein